MEKLNETGTKSSADIALIMYMQKGRTRSCKMGCHLPLNKPQTLK